MGLLSAIGFATAFFLCNGPFLTGVSAIRVSSGPYFFFNFLWPKVICQSSRCCRLLECYCPTTLTCKFSWSIANVCSSLWPSSWCRLIDFTCWPSQEPFWSCLLHVLYIFGCFTLLAVVFIYCLGLNAWNVSRASTAKSVGPLCTVSLVDKRTLLSVLDLQNIFWGCQN